MSFVIERLRGADDLDQVVAIEEASFYNPTTREWYEKELQRPAVCFIYVLRTSADHIAAFCAFWLVADQAHINNLAVRPEDRGRGLGITLLKAIVSQAEVLGATSIALEVRASNLAARRLYEKVGFAQDGVRKNYYNNPVEDALIFVRKMC